ncbi:MAG: hypothetical protein L6R38_007023 [Xanthoria sp. 2 TBL-2021]|nr:MAG: hypothetical protein L6R38_007023 [Xanthoria sp. 2 TBL-2021]
MPLFKIYRHASAGVKKSAPLLSEEELDDPSCENWRSDRETEREREQHVIWLTEYPDPNADKDITFHAPIAFFDAVAREQMGPSRTQQGCLPTEIYGLIIQHAVDPPTRHACSQVSLTFREFCTQNFLIGGSLLLLPSATFKTCTEPGITPDWFLTKDITTGKESRVTVVDDLDYKRFHTKHWGQQGFLRVFVGSEFNRKSLLPLSIRLRDVEAKERSGILRPRRRDDRLGYNLERSS